MSTLRKSSVVYIAGPMTGYPDLNRPAFFKAEEYLRSHGFKVINPAVLPADLPQDAYMPICLAMLDQADAIYLLSGWRLSDGAQLEYNFAYRQGKRLLREVDV